MKTLVRKFTVGIFTAGLFVALAFGSAGSAFAAPNTKSPPPDSPQYEAWLTNQVRHQLVMLPWYSVFDNLEYKVEGDKVTLMGQVVRPVLKSDAASVVTRIEGVKEVDNQIEVLPASPMDDHIRRQMIRAIYSFPSLQRYGMGVIPAIHIIVKNGNVTLEGAVSNQSDKDVANIRANGVPGVFSVTNNLRVEKS